MSRVKEQKHVLGAHLRKGTKARTRVIKSQKTELTLRYPLPKEDTGQSAEGSLIEIGSENSDKEGEVGAPGQPCLANCAMD